MGFFSKLFGKSEPKNENGIYAPVIGQAVPVTAADASSASSAPTPGPTKACLQPQPLHKENPQTHHP